MANELTKSSGAEMVGVLGYDPARVMEMVITAGDLSRLTPAQRTEYYMSVCTSVGLNPLTKPFDYINLGGKTVLYANKSCSDQLRMIHNVDIRVARTEYIDGVFIVTCEAMLPNGRKDTDVGVVPMPSSLQGEARSNAIMKAHTKAKRRTTLSACGLAILDESETDSIPGAQRLQVDHETGEIIEPRRTISPFEATQHRAALRGEEIPLGMNPDGDHGVPPEADYVVAEVKPDRPPSIVEEAKARQQQRRTESTANLAERQKCLVELMRTQGNKQRATDWLGSQGIEGGTDAVKGAVPIEAVIELVKALKQLPDYSASDVTDNEPHDYRPHPIEEPDPFAED